MIGLTCMYCKKTMSYGYFCGGKRFLHYFFSIDSVTKRINLFTEKTRPVIEKYKKIVKQVIH